MNFDIGFTSSNFHQVGVVARDSRANVFGSEFVGRPSKAVGEARAAWEGLVR